MFFSYTDQVKAPDFLKIDDGHEIINEDDKLLIMVRGCKSIFELAQGTVSEYLEHRQEYVFRDGPSRYYKII